MKRSLRFWTRYTWESLEVVLGAMAILAVLRGRTGSRRQILPPSCPTSCARPLSSA